MNMIVSRSVRALPHVSLQCEKAQPSTGSTQSWFHPQVNVYMLIASPPGHRILPPQEVCHAQMSSSIHQLEFDLGVSQCMAQQNFVVTLQVVGTCTFDIWVAFDI